MAFVIVFILVTLAIPLSGEIYKKGSDNLLVRCRAEAQEFMVVIVSEVKRRFGPTGEKILGFAVFLIQICVALVVLLVLFRIGLALINVMRFFHH